MAAPVLHLLDTGSGRPRGSQALDAPETILGREIIALLGGGTDASVSRRHGRIFQKDGSLFVEDLGSKNGTFVNGTRIDGALRLCAGDLIDVGAHRFLYADGSLPLEQPAPDLFAGATIAASRAGAPERLRLVYDLTRLLSDAANPNQIAEKLHGVLERALRPRLLAVWTSGNPAPIAGDMSGSPIAEDALKERTLEGGQALRAPAPNGMTSAIALPIGEGGDVLGAVLACAHDDRRFSEDDVSFIATTAALTAQAMRRAIRDAAMSISGGGGGGDRDGDELAGASPELLRAKRAADTVAGYADLSVLLVGETGTGKELFARRLHRLSQRSGPFVAVNVAALPVELVEGELFGHAKGAFTGAVAAKTGYVELARGGTLFLDEIGEMSASLQAKLLRVLQEKTISRLGDPRPIAVDIRLVAATNADLTAKMKAGQFREDLYYRIAAHEVRIPPLRERSGDVELLAETFVKKNASRAPASVPAISAEALAVLRAYPWPGNVRQLESTIRLAQIHAAADGADEIGVEHIDVRVRGASAGPAPDPGSDLARELEDSERRVVIKALRSARGHKRDAAKLLGWSINTLRDRIARYGVTDAEIES